METRLDRLEAAVFGSGVTPPGPVTSLSVVVGDGIVNLAWKAPASDGGAPISAYNISQDGVRVGSTIVALTYTRSGLTNGRAYTFSVTAVNSAGESTGTSIIATPVAAPIPPSNFTTISAAIASATSGATIAVPDGTYRELVTIPSGKILTLVAQNRRKAIIDGRDSSGRIVRDVVLQINASNAVVRGMVAQYGGAAGTRKDTNAVIAAGVSGVQIDDCELAYGGWGSLHLGEADHAVVKNCDIHHGAALGVHMGGNGTNGQQNALVSNHIHHNNPNRVASSEDEAGGVKATEQNGLTYQNNEVDNNNGPGLWNDIYCKDTLYEGNRLHDNANAGIMEEVSYRAQIHGNIAWRNGAGKVSEVGHGWGWGAGILIASSTDWEAWGNISAWNAAAAYCVVQQNRQDWPDVVPGKNGWLHDNQGFSEYDLWLDAWDDDMGGSPLYSGANNNRGSGQMYYLLNPAKTGPASEDGHSRWAWSSAFGSLTAWKGVTPGTGSRYLTDAERISILTAAGVPLLP